MKTPKYPRGAIGVLFDAYLQPGLTERASEMLLHARLYLHGKYVPEPWTNGWPVGMCREAIARPRFMMLTCKGRTNPFTSLNLCTKHLPRVDWAKENETWGVAEHLQTGPFAVPEGFRWMD